MNLRIKQGDACVVPVRIKVNGEPVGAGDVEAVEFMAGSVRKVYPEDVTYDASSGYFHVPLRQEETFTFPADDAVRFDVRVKFKGGTVIGTRKVTVLVTVDALSEEII